MHQQFNIQQLYALPHTVFMCFVFIWEQTATCTTYSINRLVFITEMKSVYSAVWSGSLNKAVCASSLEVNKYVVQQVGIKYYIFKCKCRSQWPRGLRRGSAAAPLPRLWVWIPPGTWIPVCCVLSGRGLCDGLITRPERVLIDCGVSLCVI